MTINKIECLLRNLLLCWFSTIIFETDCLHKYLNPGRKKTGFTLSENLERTRDVIIKESKNLATEQLAFKADLNHWSMGQVLDHLGLYERIFAKESDIMLSTTPDPQMDTLSLADSTYLGWMNDPGLHKAKCNAEPPV